MKKLMTMIRGDTLEFTVEIENLTEPLDSCYFSCKKNANDTQYTFQKSLGNGITKIGDNKYKVRVAPSDTHTKAVGNYLYDLQIQIGQDIYTILYGMLCIYEEITEESI